MYLAYLDESGDSGISNSPTKFFVLACVLVDESMWLPTLDVLVDMRRRLRATYGIPMRPEIKAKHIVKGTGVLRGLGWTRERRVRLFRHLMLYQEREVSLFTFAIAIEKAGAVAKGWDPRLAAWTFALQRVNRFCIANEARASIYPDEGHGAFIRKRLRQMRRHHVIAGPAMAQPVDFPVHRIVEDPNDRDSADSYFIQLADWNAYAVHRSKYIDPCNTLPGGVAQLWDCLSGRRLHAVNKERGGPPAIVKYP